MLHMSFVSTSTLRLWGLSQLSSFQPRPLACDLWSNLKPAGGACICIVFTQHSIVSALGPRVYCTQEARFRARHNTTPGCVCLVDTWACLDRRGPSRSAVWSGRSSKER
jgi:hypothetical protein